VVEIAKAIGDGELLARKRCVRQGACAHEVSCATRGSTRWPEPPYRYK
jgi:hypothetical protein